MTEKENEMKRKYPNVSISIIEEIYRRFIKGDIMEKNLAYYTAKSVILDKLKLHFDDFINKMKDDKII